MSGWNRSLLVAGLIIVSLFGGCQKKEEPSSESVLRISQRNEPGVLDPALATLPDEFFIIRALSEGLVSPSPDGGTEIAAAAKSWDISDDRLTYTFHLRTNATWSNGEPLTADDFLASYRRVLSPKAAAPKANLFFLIKGAEAFYRSELTDFSKVGFTVIDAQTLRITLAHPAPQFLSYVASGPWIPVNPRIVARHGSSWTNPRHFVGNGPFTLVNWKPNQHIIVRRRSDYWDADRVHVGAIRFQAFDNSDAEERAYRAGQIDITMSVPFTKIAGYAAKAATPLRQIPLYETRFLAFNTQRHPLGDIRVRRALALAIDRKAITEHVLRGKQTAATHFVPEGLGGFRTVSSLATDTLQARLLLAEAGYPNGKGFPVLEMTGWSQSAVLEVVQAIWKRELGITVNIGVRDAKVHVSDLTNGRYDIGFITAIPDIADAIGLLKDLSTGATNNYSQWSNNEYDALLLQSDHQTNAEERLTVLARAEEIISEQCPIAPLYFNAKNILQRNTVQGWQEDALWTRFYKDVSITTP
ncbi:MAG: ABC transporter substrate-binding protein [Opitutaceae bacterium]|jgi:oligopeptide transport system substrate-binding protein|nr:ABC transporter substrate-binding protein [Opitutaceae bacterium]|tara:strand:+ start:2806 stop:4389 length:1584 start_codon:yes stop_codon:yes gene_type:complete